MAKCSGCSNEVDPSRTPVDDRCPECWEDDLLETEVFVAWWDGMTPYEQDQYLRSQGIDPILVAAETIILVKQLTDKLYSKGDTDAGA